MSGTRDKELQIGTVPPKSGTIGLISCLYYYTACQVDCVADESAAGIVNWVLGWHLHVVHVHAMVAISSARMRSEGSLCVCLSVSASVCHSISHHSSDYSRHKQYLFSGGWRSKILSDFL